MANMSASILRNLVASIFNVKATQVKLSGELPENFVLSECNSTGSLFDCNQKVAVWAFESKTGFVKVKGANSYRSQNADGSWNNEYGVAYSDCANHSEAIFFLVHNKEWGWQEGRANWNTESWTLYKAPDFKSHLEKIEQSDVQRWEEWLNA